MSLAIAEKRPQQRPGGCVSVFFHHLFSKKKLFSTKLLTPVKRAAAAKKKFAGEEEVPMGKLLLINNENQSGYSKPESKTGAGSRMQVPGIVARLMGLESMPLVPHEKHRKAMDFDLCNDSDFEHSRLYHGLCSDNAGDRKAESRPQKLQKTESLSENAEGNVFHNRLITESRKKQQVRLGPPAKNPRVISRSNTARLIQVANKILEPGLHSRSRARPAIMYRSSLEGDGNGGKEPLSDSLVGSCCSRVGLVTAKEPLVSEFGCSVFDSGNLSEEGKKLKSAAVPSCKSKSPEDQTKLKSEEGSKSKPVVVLSGQVKNGSLAVQAKFNVKDGVHNPVERKQGEGTIEERLKKSYVKRNSLRQNQLPPIRDQGVLGAKVCSRKQPGRDLDEFQNAGKDFLAFNKNLSNRAHSRSPTKVSMSWEKNMGQKKRPNRSSQIGSAKSVSSTFGKEKSAGSYVNKRKETNSLSTASSCIKTATQKLDGNNLDGSKGSGIISFTFNSPMRCDSRSPTYERMLERRRDQDELRLDACHRNKLTSDENIGSSSSAKRMALGGVELSSLLEEKIRELSSLDQHELTTGDDLPGRSTASILEELISALTVGAPESQNNDDNFSDVSIRTDISIAHNQFSKIDREFQEKAQPGIVTAYLMSDGNQPSPVSILEASFSNYSCSFGSPNGSSGCKPQFGLPEISLDPDADLVDTATSLNNCQPGDEKIHHSINNSSSIYEVLVSKTESSIATGAISDAELFFGSILLSWSNGSVESFDSFLLDTVETITNAFLLKFNAKEENPLRWLLYDRLMESLNSKFSLFCKSSYISWMKLPLILGKEQLMQEVHAEIIGWWDLAGNFLDGPVEKEISTSNTKWTERKAETFDVGVEIQHDILQTLIHEMLIDLC